MLLIEILRAGRHIAMNGEAVTIGPAELAELVRSYDPAVHEAPIVVGHPTTNDPAYGWVKALAVAPAGATLTANADQVDPAFAELVRSGRYKKVSSSVYKPDSPGNPKPGSWYLRHVGFLGATPPAVKGLRDASFREKDATGIVELADEMGAAGVCPTCGQPCCSSCGCCARCCPTWAKQPVEAGKAPGACPTCAGACCSSCGCCASCCPSWCKQTGPVAPPAPAPAPAAAPTPAPPAPASLSEAERAAALDKRILELERTIAERERQARRQDHLSFCERLVAQGRPLPCPPSTLVNLLEALDAVPAGTVSFGEAETRRPSEILRAEVLARLPKQVGFAELSAAGEGSESEDPVAVGRRAEAYREEQRAKGVHISTTAAVKHVSRKHGGT